MTCSHISITQAVTGQIGTCSKCQQPIIHDGVKWRWLYDMDPTKRAKLQTAYRVDALTGKHA